jgi:hypothetical protein
MSDLETVERQNVAEAIQLIREAGYRDKASLLDDMLQGNDIKHDPFLDRTVLAETRKFLLYRRINLNPDITPLRRLPRNSPELVRLAGVLLHEADHALCHDELDAFGEELAFYQALNRDFGKYFPRATPQEKRAIENRKRTEEDDARRQRETIAGRGGTGYGEGHRERTEYAVPRASLHELRSDQKEVLTELAEIVYPGSLNSVVLDQMDQIANALFRYRDSRGTFPEGGNARMVAALRKANLSPLRPGQLGKKGEALDPWGSPYVYRIPGEIFPDEFDLYSIGPCKKDHGGAEGNIVCELHRR